MQVAKWGNSLAIRIPSSVVDALDLKEGDDISVSISNDCAVEIERDDRRLKALERIKSFGVKLPVDWKFDRNDANAR
ncbi:AbrB/MazE/SpoVT family DNA-binding domain-containing protein [Rhizobium tumorigenes]|uniref:AbrB/MazE/SpoVT family DNA-binding domain-containing protein n=1 Tax=Rhizobium tumorigenes TaxID=2041385 RepID=A0AAF1KW68_9HYPH|nr:AbrB/MazE/SpoVT family DNA-binding domain-containing protein [Rhizobium tumorigenes]WFR95964.1 AbrB/MazE/SpoVT family DNA-binding domain-containing protein [Rhizobium tumorigenes]